MSARILVVDDEETLCEALRFNLEAEGYFVSTAHSAEELLAINLNGFNLLKTPVASIRLCLETLITHPDISAEQRAEFLRRCLANSERLEQLLADVALITRMEDGAHTIERTRVGLAQTIAHVVTERTNFAAAKGFEIQNNVTQPLVIEGNASLLESVFHNLIDNAIAYSEGSRIEIALRVTTSRKVVISLSDNGVGVSEEHLSRLFERFYRVDKGGGLEFIMTFELCG